MNDADSSPVADRDHRKIVLGIQVLDHDSWMGGTIYVRNLIYALNALDPSDRPSVRLIGAEHARAALVEELMSFDFVHRPASWNRVASIAERAVRRLRRSVTRSTQPDPFDGIDIVFPSLHTAPAGRARRLFWIPDFQHEHMPALFPAEELTARREKDSAIARSVGHLVLSSRMALEDFRRLYPDAQVIPHVWSFCTTLTAHERGGRDPHATYGIPRKYLYIPNQFWAHKNHETAFRAVQLLAAKGIEVDLVCTGFEDDARNRDHVADLKRFVTEAGLGGRIHFLGLVPRNDQIEIFRHAAAVLQPSLFEGWSTVVEDAKAIGRPLILSDFPVHKEQMGAAGHFFPGRDPAALAALIEQVWPKLEPGPDPLAETAAARDGQRRQVETASAFLDIIRRACEPEAAR